MSKGTGNLEFRVQSPFWELRTFVIELDVRIKARHRLLGLG